MKSKEFAAASAADKKVTPSRPAAYSEPTRGLAPSCRFDHAPRSRRTQLLLNAELQKQVAMLSLKLKLLHG